MPAALDGMHLRAKIRGEVLNHAGEAMAAAMMRIETGTIVDAAMRGMPIVIVT